MHSIIVNIQIKPEFVDAFAEAARAHANHAMTEPGCMRFDVLQFKDDPTHFMYLEVFKDDEASKVHGATEATLAFREKTGPWRAQTNVPSPVTVLAPANLG